jgi:hypothetical protein
MFRSNSIIKEAGREVAFTRRITRLIWPTSPSFT